LPDTRLVTKVISRFVCNVGSGQLCCCQTSWNEGHSR